MSGKFLTGYDDAAAVFDDFRVAPEDRIGADILYAHYENEDWCGSAIVVFRQDGALFCVEGSHCSCNGLADQWEPTRTTVAALRMMPKDEGDRPAFTEFLDAYTALYGDAK